MKWQINELNICVVIVVKKKSEILQWADRFQENVLENKKINHILG